MKSSSFDLEELNCWNKNLDIGLDVSEHNLDSFLHETCLLGEFVVIFEKSYLTHMTTFLAANRSVDRPLSQESKQIDFASIGLLYLYIFKSEWSKVNIDSLRDLTLKAAISMLFLILFS
jgi:hypothetical protein